MQGGSPAYVSARQSRIGAVKAALAAVILFHLDGLRAGGDPVPGAGTVVEWVEV